MYAYLIAGALLATICLYNLYQSDLWGPASSVPGPFITRITQFWELKALMDSRNYTEVIRGLHDKYGPVVRLSPGRYSISDAEAARDIYHHGTKYFKGYFYHSFQTISAEDNVFADRDAARHAKSRRSMASMYSMGTLKSYEPSVDDVSSTFKDRLAQFAREGASICLSDWLQFYAFDVIGMMTFSSPFGLLESGKDDMGILESLFSLNHTATAMGVAAPGWWIWLFKMSQMLPLQSSKLSAFNRWLAGRVEARTLSLQRERSDIRSDFLEKTIDAHEQGKMSAQARWNVIRQNVAAGSDTTGVSLTAVAWYLATHPAALRKLRAELADAKDQNRLSSPVTFAEATALPYLQAVIKESLRLHPAVGLMLERVVPPGGATLAGHFFPEGVRVGCSAWQLNYDKTVWGNDAHEFRPERWLLEDQEAVKRLDGALFSFGAGSRTCLGRNISLLEMSKLVPELYRRFDFELCSPERSISATFFVYHKFDVRVKELEKVV